MRQTAVPLHRRAVRGVALALAGTSLVLGIATFAGTPNPEAAVADEAPAYSHVEYNLFEPIVSVREDGTFIHRVPNENVSASSEATAKYHHPEENVPYNTYFLKADAKGCNACHDDLAEVVANMPCPMATSSFRITWVSRSPSISASTATPTQALSPTKITSVP